jgi:acyl carrier protein
VREDSPGDQRLVAYLVPAQESLPSLSELRALLAEKLPDYMLPSLFVPLEQLPLTPNGKVDRRALPAPDQTRPELAAAFVPPRTPSEEIVAEIWAAVLGVKEVGVHDNFFELGGHSLMATQVVARLRGVFRVEIPLRSLFERPTIEGLVNEIARKWGGLELLDEIARTLKEVAQLSDDEVKAMLSQQETGVR